MFDNTRAILLQDLLKSSIECQPVTTSNTLKIIILILITLMTFQYAINMCL